MNRPGRTPTTCVAVQRVSAVASVVVVEIRRCGGLLRGIRTRSCGQG